MKKRNQSHSGFPQAAALPAPPQHGSVSRILLSGNSRSPPAPPQPLPTVCRSGRAAPLGACTVQASSGSHALPQRGLLRDRTGSSAPPGCPRTAGSWAVRSCCRAPSCCAHRGACSAVPPTSRTPLPDAAARQLPFPKSALPEHPASLTAQLRQQRVPLKYLHGHPEHGSSSPCSHPLFCLHKHSAGIS